MMMSVVTECVEILIESGAVLFFGVVGQTFFFHFVRSKAVIVTQRKEGRKEGGTSDTVKRRKG